MTDLTSSYPPPTRLVPSWVRLALVSIFSLCASATSLAQDFGIRGPEGSNLIDVSVTEGAFFGITVSLTGPARGAPSTISISSDFDPIVEYDPSPAVTIANGVTTEFAISIKYDDNHRASVLPSFTVAELGTGRQKSFSINPFEDDMAGLVFDPGTDIGTVRVGSTVSLTVRLTSQPLNRAVALTVGYATEAGAANAVTVGISPTVLMFNQNNWNRGQQIALSTSTESTMGVAIDYRVTVGVDPGPTTDSDYDSVMPTTLSFELRISTFAEVINPPDSMDEGSGWTTFAISFPEARTTTANFVYSVDTSDLPDPDGLEMRPSDGAVEIQAGETSKAVSIRYDDDIDSDDFSLMVVISEPSESAMLDFPIIVTDNDTVGLQIGSVVAGDMATDLGVLRVNGTERVDVRLNSRPTDDVVVTLGYTSEVGDSNAVTVGIMPAGLTFTANNWETNQTLTIAPSTESTVAMTITDYRITVGFNPAETDDDMYDPVKATLVATLVNAAFVEIEVLPSASVDERATIEIRYSLPEESGTGTRLTFSTDTVLPDSGALRFSPSDSVLIRDTLEHTVHVTYNDDIDGADTNISVVIADADDPSRSGSQLLTFTDDDNAGLQVNGVDVTTAGDSVSLGVLRINRTESINVRLNTRPDAGATVEVAVGYTDVTSAVTVEITPTALTFTAADWDRGKSFSVTPSTGSTVAMTFAYTITVGTGAGTDASEYMALDDILLEATLETSRFTEEDVAATEVAIAAVDLGASQFALDAIGGNFNSGNRTQLAPSLNLGGTTSALAMDPADPWSQGEGWRGDFVTLLDGGSFRLPLGAGTGLGSLEVWGEGRLLDVSGDGDLDDGSTYIYDGGAKGFVLGFGLRGQGGRLGYGIAVARTNSHVDLDGESLSVERIDNDLVTLLPYVGMSFGANSRAWLVGGVGEGEAELLMSGEVEKTDSTVRSLGLGLEHTTRRGDYDLSGRLLASGSRSTLDGTEDLPDLANVRGTAHRLRAEAEAERDMDLGGRGDGTVFGVAALRRDGGDAGGSFGLELGVGMRARLHDAYTVELEGRHQINSSSHEESSVRVRLGYDTQGDGRGLGLGLDESGGASVGYGWGRTVLGRHGVLSVGVGREGYGEVATTKLGFVSPGLRMSVAGDADEYRADFDLIVLGR